MKKALPSPLRHSIVPQIPLWNTQFSFFLATKRQIQLYKKAQDLCKNKFFTCFHRTSNFIFPFLCKKNKEKYQIEFFTAIALSSSFTFSVCNFFFHFILLKNYVYCFCNNIMLYNFYFYFYFSVANIDRYMYALHKIFKIIIIIISNSCFFPLYGVKNYTRMKKKNVL